MQINPYPVMGYSTSSYHAASAIHSAYQNIRTNPKRPAYLSLDRVTGILPIGGVFATAHFETLQDNHAIAFIGSFARTYQILNDCFAQTIAAIDAMFKVRGEGTTHYVTIEPLVESMELASCNSEHLENIPLAIVRIFYTHPTHNDTLVGWCVLTTNAWSDFHTTRYVTSSAPTDTIFVVKHHFQLSGECLSAIHPHMQTACGGIALKLNALKQREGFYPERNNA